MVLQNYLGQIVPRKYEICLEKIEKFYDSPTHLFLVNKKTYFFWPYTEK